MPDRWSPSKSRQCVVERFPGDLNAADTGGWRTGATPLDESLDGQLRTLEDRLDPSVEEVTHRSAETFGRGFARAGISEEDPLNPPAHEDARADGA